MDLLDKVTQFNEGFDAHAYRIFGAHSVDNDQFRFVVWAPRAYRVAVVGEFSNWEPVWMERLFESGVWVKIIGSVYDGQSYKYLIEDAHGRQVLKSDPFARAYEVPPQDASVIVREKTFDWDDQAWLDQRGKTPITTQPLNIYEVHATSWMKHYDGRNYTLYELAEALLPYVKKMGYTHVEFMPMMHHPLEASWGYQITGYFAVASRYGDIEGLKYFVNAAHRLNIGVILDWVPGHFCQNHDALAYFDGTPTFEYENEVMAKNLRWGALNFDLGKTQVQSFLTSSMFYWLETFHVDGIRVDAVSNMLYLDYDLPPHVLNDDGTNVNRQGVYFLQTLNRMVHEQSSAFTVAEESTAWYGVTHPIQKGGLGFDFKWNMGWMNDTLKFFELDPLYRKDHMSLLTFVYMYHYNENYILALSHDEVVHGKHSLLTKMPGDRYKQFAQLKVLYAWMLFLPGKKLNFMGNEIGQYLEWRYYEELEWGVLGYDYNREYQYYVSTVNAIYQHNNALWEMDTYEQGLDIIQASHSHPLVIAMVRKSKDRKLMVVLNFEPQEHQNYRVGVKEKGTYRVLVNSEMSEFGGTWVWQQTQHEAQEIASDNCEYSIEVIVPAYGVLILEKGLDGRKE